MVEGAPQGSRQSKLYALTVNREAGQTEPPDKRRPRQVQDQGPQSASTPAIAQPLTCPPQKWGMATESLGKPLGPGLRHRFNDVVLL